MIDTEATRDRIHELEMDSDGYLKTINLFWDVLKDVDAQAEEIKHLREVNTVIKNDQGPIVAVNIKLQKEIERLREALGNMAKQQLIAEMDEEDRDYADYEGAYEIFINQARAAIKTDTEEGET